MCGVGFKAVSRDCWLLHDWSLTGNSHVNWMHHNIVTSGKVASLIRFSCAWDKTKQIQILSDIIYYHLILRNLIMINVYLIVRISSDKIIRQNEYQWIFFNISSFSSGLHIIEINEILSELSRRIEFMKKNFIDFFNYTSSKTFDFVKYWTISWF